MLQSFFTFQEAENYLNNIPRAVIRFDSDPDSFIRKQTKFLDLIGNPQSDLKVIHIAGTSGKGSTVTILANILLSQKFKVASSISPHIGNICERFQINEKPISQEKFLEYFNNIIPAINQIKSEGIDPSYFEILTALQFYMAKIEKVDYTITEVGMGGKYDATNIFIPNKLCIINSIGLDHVAILGDTLVKIAGEKAGIIQSNNQVIALSQSLEINAVFVNKARDMKAHLDFVIPDFCFENVKQYEGKTYFSYIDQDLLDRQIALGMLGKYQATNASLALRATEALSERDGWKIDWDRLKYQLQSTKLIGRFEVQNLEGKTIIIDGAHNPQKIQAFISSLIEYYPDRKFDLLLAFKKGKDVDQMLDEILKYKDQINQITLTKFDGSQDTQIESQDVKEIQEYLIKNSFERFEIEENLQKAYTLIQKNIDTISVITGSLYLISAIKNLKY